MGASPWLFWLQLLLCSLLTLGHRIPRVQNIYNKIDNLQIIDIVYSSAPVQLSSEGTINILGKSVQNVFNNTDNLQIINILLQMATVEFSSEGTKNVLDKKIKEVETLKKIVGLLEEMIKNKLREQAQSQLPTKLTPSPSVNVDNQRMNITLKDDGMQIEATQADTLTCKVTTAFPKLRSNASASAVLLSNITTYEKAKPENLRNDTIAPIVIHPDNVVSEKPVATVSPLMENYIPTDRNSKTLGQLTNGALSSLVESLKNVKRLYKRLHASPGISWQEDRDESKMEVDHQMFVEADILELINGIIKTIKTAPSPIKNDPAVHNHIGKAENFLKEALELEEMKLMRSKENKGERQLRSSTSTNLPEVEMSVQLTSASSHSLAKKSHNIQVKMGNLKVYAIVIINLIVIIVLLVAVLLLVQRIRPRKKQPRIVFLDP